MSAESTRRPAGRAAGILFTVSLCVLASARAAADETCDARLAQVKPPPADLPSGKDRGRLHGCSPIDLYYGLGEKPADMRDARLCALIEVGDNGGTPMPTDGAGILMAIYANGSGVARNARLAKHFACMIDWKPEDQQQLLDNIDTHARLGTPVDVCDVEPFWPVNDICAGYAEAAELRRAERELQSLTSALPASRRAAIVPLQQAETAYERKREPSEIFPGDRGGRQDEIRRGFLGEFRGALKAIDAPGGLPARNQAALDRELNAAYRKTVKAVELAKADRTDALTPEELRDGERAWLRYADAWEKFRAAAYPNVPSERLRALLTEQRIAALRAVKIEFSLDDYWPTE